MSSYDRALIVAAILAMASSGCGSDSGPQSQSKGSGGTDGGGPLNGTGEASGTSGNAGGAGAAGSGGTASSAGGTGNGASNGAGGTSSSAGGSRGTNGGSDSDAGNVAGASGHGQDGGASGGSAGSGGSGTGGDPSASVVSGTRLKAKFVTSADGAKSYRRGVLYDSKLKVDCAYATASDGKTRCLPTGSFVVSAPILYADSKCTQLVIWLGPTGAVGCPWNPPPYAMTGQTVGHCTQAFQQQIFPIEGTIIDNAGVFQKNGTNCTGAGVSYPGAVAVLLKDEVSPTEFVEGTPAVAP